MNPDQESADGAGRFPHVMESPGFVLRRAPPPQVCMLPFPTSVIYTSARTVWRFLDERPAASSTAQYHAASAFSAWKRLLRKSCCQEFVAAGLADSDSKREPFVESLTQYAV